MRKRALLMALIMLCLACFSAQAEVAVSPFGYTMSYDPSAFLYIHMNDADVYEWRLSTGEMAARVEVRHEAKASVKDMGVTEPSETMKVGETLASVVMTQDNPVGLPSAAVYVPDGKSGVWVFNLAWDPQVMSTAKETMLNMVSTVYPGKKAVVAHAQCDICGGFYPEGNIFRNHICAGTWFDAEPGVCVLTSGSASPTAPPKPRATRKPSAQSETEMVYCELCGNWYESGNVFRNHVCMPREDYYYCDICGGTYEGNAFDNHVCVPKVEYVYCDVCGGSYEAGNVFLNHVCVPKVEYVYCDVCGGTYEAGNVFRNHVCIPAEP